LILTFSQGHKVLFFYSTFLSLLYGAIFSKLNQAVQDLLQNAVFDL